MSNASKTVLQVPLFLDTCEFKEKLKAKAFLLFHKAIDDYISNQVKKERNILGKVWETQRTETFKLNDYKKQNSELNSILRIKITGLLLYTGQSTHIELCGENYNGLPALYVDSNITADFLNIVTNCKIDEIIQWENLRVNLLGLDQNNMWQWIKNHIDTPDECLEKTVYEGLTSCQIAKLFYKKASSLDPLYEKFVDKEIFDYSYINTLLSIYGYDENNDSANVAPKAFDDEAPVPKSEKQETDSLRAYSKNRFYFWENLKAYGTTAGIIVAVVIIEGVLFTLIHSYVRVIPLNKLFGLGKMPLYLNAMSHTNLKIIVGYNVFLISGEFIAQLMRFRNDPKTRHGMKFQIDWKKIGAVFLLINFLYCWFWPFTYEKWRLKSVPLWMLGLADQPFTGLISISAAFLIHSLVECFSSGDKNLSKERTLWQIICAKSDELVKTLRGAFPYWVIVLGIIFGVTEIGFSLSFSTQNMLVSFFEIPFAIYMFYMAGGKSAESPKLQMKLWAKFAVLPAIIYSFVFFAVDSPFIIASWLSITAGSFLYVVILYFGFINQKTTKNDKDSISTMCSSSEKKGSQIFNNQQSEFQKGKDTILIASNNIAQEKKQEAGFENITVFGTNVENALVIMNELAPIFFKKNEIYEFRYNKTRFDEYNIKNGLLHEKSSPEAVLLAYVNLLRIRAPHSKNIKIIPQGKGSAPLIEVSRYVSKSSKFSIGEGSINIEGSLDDQLLQIVGMVNIIFALSHIPDNISLDEINKYNHLICFIKNQYKTITGEELFLVRTSKVMRHITLPKTRMLPLISLAEYYRLTIQQLYQFA